MGKYRRISESDRYQIYAFLQVGLSLNEISTKIGFHKSSVSREIKRNHHNNLYNPKTAQYLCNERHQSKGAKPKMTESMKSLVHCLLEKSWSPEQISKRLEKETQIKISHQTIYNHIYDNKDLKIYLRRPKTPGPGRYLQRKSKWENRLHISQRPLVVENRDRIGDWERDTMYGANREQILVCVDRKTNYIKISRIEKYCSKWINQKTLQMIKGTGRKLHTMTNDNGSEFLGKSTLGVPTYYCTPMRPQERGTVENTVGLLRQFISRKTNISELNDEVLDYFEGLMNHRPRKKLNYKTPYEVYFNKNVALIT